MAYVVWGLFLKDSSWNEMTKQGPRYTDSTYGPFD
jgi:hypothetical protein